MGLRVGFVGAGMMAEAIAGGLDAAGVAKFADMSASNRTQPRLDVFASWGVTPRASNSEVAQNCDVIFISVKPYTVAQVLEEMRPVLSKDTLVVSVAAGDHHRHHGGHRGPRRAHGPRYAQHAVPGGLRRRGDGRGDALRAPVTRRPCLSSSTPSARSTR